MSLFDPADLFAGDEGTALTAAVLQRAAQIAREGVE